jgi:hypothetical protein
LKEGREEGSLYTARFTRTKILTGLGGKGDRE